MIILLVVVDHAVAPPPPPEVRSVCQLGRPPLSLRTRPFVLTGSFVNTPEPFAYNKSPAVYVEMPVPPLDCPRADASVSAPVLENDDVAVVPKYAYPAERPVVDAFAPNDWRADQVFAVVVPKAKEIVLAVFTIGYVNEYAEPALTHEPLTAKHPEEILNPTFDVDVACPEILKPRTVVVPNPEPDISRTAIDVVERPSTVDVER